VRGLGRKTEIRGSPGKPMQSMEGCVDLFLLESGEGVGMALNNNKATQGREGICKRGAHCGSLRKTRGGGGQSVYRGQSEIEGRETPRGGGVGGVLGGPGVEGGRISSQH